jgi:hypothetical protein
MYYFQIDNGIFIEFRGLSEDETSRLYVKCCINFQIVLLTKAIA